MSYQDRLYHGAFIDLSQTLLIEILITDQSNTYYSTKEFKKEKSQNVFLRCCDVDTYLSFSFGVPVHKTRYEYKLKYLQFSVTLPVITLCIDFDLYSQKTQMTDNGGASIFIFKYLIVQLLSII